MKYLISFWPFLVVVMALAALYGGLDTAAWVLGGLGFLLLFLLAWMGLWDKHSEELQQRAWLMDNRRRFLMTLGEVSPDKLKFISVEWTELGVDFGISPIVYILKDGQNTKIQQEFLQKFIEDSDKREFADVRRYNDDKFLQERFEVSRDRVRAQWYLAVDFLTREGFLIPDSARGPHSFMWKSEDHYRKLFRKYAKFYQFPNLDEAQHA